MTLMSCTNGPTCSTTSKRHIDRRRSLSQPSLIVHPACSISHFVAEDILGGYRSGFSTLPQDRAESIVAGRGKESLFDHVIIPYEWHWKDDKGLNEATIRKGLGVDRMCNSAFDR